jgi:hypothetical protein
MKPAKEVTLEDRDSATFPDVVWEMLPDLQKQPTYSLTAPTLSKPSVDLLSSSWSINMNQIGEVLRCSVVDGLEYKHQCLKLNSFSNS